jgi:hypothetical protein
MKHLRNQSTLIFCSNLSVILYDPYLCYINTFAIENNSDVYKVELSEKDTILIVYTKDSQNVYNILFYSMIDQSYLYYVDGYNAIYMQIFYDNDWQNHILIYKDIASYWPTNLKLN